MFKDQYVFAQLVSFLDRNHFNYLVKKYGGDRYIKSFFCWNQLQSLMFGQLTNRQGLRDLTIALEAHRLKYYHLGVGKISFNKEWHKSSHASGCRNSGSLLFVDNGSEDERCKCNGFYSV